jgi:hypothetical protein
MSGAREDRAETGKRRAARDLRMVVVWMRQWINRDQTRLMEPY